MAFCVISATGILEKQLSVINVAIPIAYPTGTDNAIIRIKEPNNTAIFKLPRLLPQALRRRFYTLLPSAIILR